MKIFVPKEMIKVIDEVKDWKESIDLSSKLLYDNDYINNDYVIAILKNIEEMGPYILLTPELIMPHARPEDGALKTGLSFLKLKNEVDFYGNRVKLILTLSSKDSDTHIDYVKKIVDLIDDEEKYEKLLSLNSEKELYKLINN